MQFQHRQKNKKKKRATQRKIHQIQRMVPSDSKMFVQRKTIDNKIQNF